MRLTAVVLTAGFLPWAATASILETRADNISFDASTIAKLPPCLLQCASTVLPKFDCQPGDSCYCDVSGPLKDALSTCVAASCTKVEDQLVGIRLQAEVCGYPTHHDAPHTETVAYALFGIASVFLAARFMSRWPRMNGAGYGWDDWIILIAYPVAIEMTVTAHYAVVYGSGKDMYYLTANELIHFFTWMFVGEPLYIVVTCLTQLSLVFLYLRVWPTQSVDNNSNFRMACKVVAWILVATMLAFTISSIFGCRPLEAGWNLQLGHKAVCINRTAAGYSLAAITIVIHVVVLLLPVPRLVKLKIPLGEKIGVLVTFLLGFVVTICSVVRMFYIYKTATVVNITYNYSFVGLWSLIEVYCTIICCCIPATAGLFRKLLSNGCFRGLWIRSFTSMSRSRVTQTPADHELDTMRRNCLTSPTYEMDAADTEPKVSVYKSSPQLASVESVATESELYDRIEQAATMKDHTAFDFGFYSGPNQEYQPAGTRGADFWYKKTRSPPSTSPLASGDTTPKHLTTPERSSRVPEFWFYDRAKKCSGDKAAVTPMMPIRPIPPRISSLTQQFQNGPTVVPTEEANGRLRSNEPC